MRKFTKKTTIILALVSVTGVVFADRGTGKRSKAKTSLNINTTSSPSLKNSILANIKNGLAYKGSFIATRQANTGVSSFSNNTLMTYQKGNTTFILPYQQKISIPSAANCNKNSNSLQLLNLKVRMHK